MASSDLEHAVRLARSITDESRKNAALEGIAEIVAGSDPDHAVRLARSITDEEKEIAALGKVAEVAADSDPYRAVRLARSIAVDWREPSAPRWVNAAGRTNPYGQPTSVKALVASILSKVVIALAASNPKEAELLVHLIDPGLLKVSALAHIAKIRLQG